MKLTGPCMNLTDKWRDEDDMAWAWYVLTGHNEWKYENEILFQKVLAAVDALTRTRPGNVKITSIHRQIFSDIHWAIWYCKHQRIICQTDFVKLNFFAFSNKCSKFVTSSVVQVCIIFVSKHSHHRSKYFWLCSVSGPWGFWQLYCMLCDKTSYYDGQWCRCWITIILTMDFNVDVE